MNPAPTIPWTCRVVRTWRAVVARSPAAGDHRPTGMFARHIARCADCQQYFARISALDNALRSTAPAPEVAFNEDLHRRIVRAVGDLRPEAHRARRSRGPVLLAIAAGAAVAVLLVLLPTRHRSIAPPSPTPASIHGSPRPAVQPLAVTSPRAAQRELPPPSDATEPLDALAPVAAALAHDPLQSEVDSVYADARNAVRFLALNFLPSDVVADVRTDRTRGRELQRNGG